MNFTMIRTRLHRPALNLLAGLLVGLLVALPPARAADTDDAVTVVSKLQSGLLRIDRENGKRNNGQRYDAFAPLIQSTHDLGFMARLAVSRYWGAFTPEERKRFEGAFARLSVMGYAARFRDTAGNSFRVAQVRAVPGGRVEVATQLLAPSEAPISLNYVLHQDKAGWKIINILAEGVSDLALQRSQYQQVMQSQGFDGLIRHLEQKTADLETQAP